MANLAVNFDKYKLALQDVSPEKDIGKVTEVTGLVIKAFITGCSVGSICSVHTLMGGRQFLAEVVGFSKGQVLLMPLKEVYGIGPGSRVEVIKSKATVGVGADLLGRVVDGLGQPLDNGEPLVLDEELPLYGEIVNPMQRDIISESLSVGVRAIDGLITIGKGQRMGILAGSGVGKSMLLGMMAKNTTADVNVIALIGERGREVREFIEYNLGPEGLSRSVIVAVTSEQSPLVRMRGAFFATTIAEYFAAQGANVLLFMDSVTRFAMAQREVGLSTGEPPASKGYTPSVFSLLPKLLERAGNFVGAGSITGIYSVLVEGDDMDEPIADAVRSIVDGHIVLDRKIAQRAHFPAIDVLQSTSRVMRNVTELNHIQAAQLMRESMAVYRDAEDLINIGAYKAGANPKIDRAIQIHDKIENFLKQHSDEGSDFRTTLQRMAEVLGGK